eukprot:919670-Prymnesium_polylepis.1
MLDRASWSCPRPEKAIPDCAMISTKVQVRKPSEFQRKCRFLLLVGGRGRHVRLQLGSRARVLTGTRTCVLRVYGDGGLACVCVLTGYEDEGRERGT